MTEIRRARGRGGRERAAAPARARSGRARDLALERRRRHQRLGRPAAPHLRAASRAASTAPGTRGSTASTPTTATEAIAIVQEAMDELLHLRAAPPDRAARREAPLDRGARQGARRSRREPRRHHRLRPGRDRADPDGAATGGRRRPGAAAPGGHGGVLPGADARPGRGRARGQPRAGPRDRRRRPAGGGARTSSCSTPSPRSARSPTSAPSCSATRRRSPRSCSTAWPRARCRRSSGSRSRRTTPPAATTSSTSAGTGTTPSAPCGGGLALVVGDVMGRGVRAATTMIHVRAGIRGLLTVEPDPAALLEAADALMARDAPGAVRHGGRRAHRPGRRDPRSSATPGTCRWWWSDPTARPT